MKSMLDERLGETQPVILHLPPNVVSLAAAEETIELANRFGVANGYDLCESQNVTLRAALGERADGSWAATRIANFGPRQGTGKNDTIAARELAGLILFGERLIIHTAHEFPTANESFLRLVAVFENFDELRAKVARIRYANGEQGIEFLSGQRLKYRARTGGSGRGFAQADLIVYDEAQHLSREHIAASGPARLAAPNSQTWYAGSGGLKSSNVAWAMRRQALDNAGSRLAYTESTGELVTVVDGIIESVAPAADDVDAWVRAMPGLGRWVSHESMESLFEDLGPELFARECLCVWDAEDGRLNEVVSAAAWLANLTGECRPVPPVAYAVDVSPYGKSAAVAVSDGLSVVVAEHRPGVDWVAGVVGELLEKVPGPVYVDPRGSGAVVQPIEALGVVPVLVSAVQYSQACGGFLAAVMAKKVSHAGQNVLDVAVANATRRDYGDSWAWNRRSSSVDICPLVAVTLARWGALTMEIVAPSEPPMVAYR